MQNQSTIYPLSLLRENAWQLVMYVLGWFIPPVVSVILLVQDFSWLALTLAGLFCVVGFVILPKDSQRHCQDCEMVDCPRRPHPGRL